MGPGPLFRMNQSEVNISPLFVVLAKFLKCHVRAAKTPGPVLKIIKRGPGPFFLFVRMYDESERGEHFTTFCCLGEIPEMPWPGSQDTRTFPKNN